MLLGMDFTSVRNALTRGFTVLRRERRWGSTLLMLSLTMVILQILLAGALSLKGVEGLLNAQSGIHLEVARTASDQKIQELYAALKELPYVQEVTYVPKEKAYEREKLRDPELVRSLEQFSVQNPFPDTFSVVLTELGSFEELLTFVEAPQWNGTVDPSFLATAAAQENDVRSYLTVSRSALALLLLLLWACIACVVVMVGDLALQRAHERSAELTMENLMGATPFQAALPLAAEIAILLLLSLAIGFGVTVVLLLLMPLFVPGLASGGAFAEARAYVVPLLTFVYPLVALLEAVLLAALAVGCASVAAGLKIPPKRRHT
jgi:cell division protein FtsX